MLAVSFIYSLSLVILGLFAYFIWGDRASLTALIPSFAGALFLLVSLVSLLLKAETTRIYWAVGVLSGVLVAGSFGGLMKLPKLLAGEDVVRPLAVQVQSATAMLGILFLTIFAIVMLRSRKS